MLLTIANYSQNKHKNRIIYNEGKKNENCLQLKVLALLQKACLMKIIFSKLAEKSNGFPMLSLSFKIST